MLWVVLFTLVQQDVLGQGSRNYQHQATVPNTLTDICQWEIFDGQCQSNEVIILDRAEYGRLGQGRCQSDSSSVSNSECQSNVLGPADIFCSGKPQCEITVPNADFESTNDCHTLYRGYFRASYKCMPVMTSSICSSGRIEARSSGSVISSYHMKQSPCSGSYNRVQLTVTSKPGQQINVTFIDFSWDIRNLQSGSETSYPSCISYGFVKDQQTGRTEEICGGQQRTKELMLSLGNSLQLDLQPIPNDRQFLIVFQALGCEDIRPPRGAWMNRSHTAVTVGCTDSPSQTWTLRCVQGEWRGRPIGNCTNYVQAPHKDTPVAWQPMVLPDSIVIAIIAAVAFLICIGITTLGVVCYKRATVKQEYYQGTLQLMQYNTAKRSLRYTGTPPIRLQQQQQQTLRPTPIPEESPYYSPAYPQSLARRRSDGTNECTYESLHILDRPIPEEGELPGERDPLNSEDLHEARTLPVAGTSRSARYPDDQDAYNDSIASTSTQPKVSKDPKYYVLDKNYIQRHNIDLQDD